MRHLLALVRGGTLHGRHLYVFQLAQLCRTGVAGTLAVLGELRQAGVTLVVVADKLTIVPEREDTTSEMLVFALGLAARLERAAVNDRIAAARERVESDGGAGAVPAAWGATR